MKITIGGTKKMTLSKVSYSPVAAESTFIIEVDTDDYNQDEIDKMQEKANNFITKDLRIKMKELLNDQDELLNKAKKLMD
ncbi:MAG: hypothetical protein ACOC3V_01560 [bacterium]